MKTEILRIPIGLSYPEIVKLTRNFTGIVIHTITKSNYTHKSKTLYKNGKPIYCSRRPTIETRKDKYGQNIKLTCRCGATTNWHCEKWKAEPTFWQIEHNSHLIN